MVKGLEPLTRVAPSLGPFYHIKHNFGAVGDGIADDTPAFQAALDLFKYSSSTKGGRVLVPAGTYNITGLTYEGNFDHGFVMQGDTQGEGGSADGPVLKYTGSSGGTLLLLKGANWCRFEDVQFNGNGLALICVDVQYDSVRSMSSFDCTWRHCGFSGAVGADSMCMRWGTSNFASAEHRAIDCRFINHSTPGTTYYGLGTTGSANTKNHTIERCRFIGFRWGVSFSNSGYHKVDGCSFASQTIADVKVSRALVSIKDCGSEGSAKFIDRGGVAVQGSLKISSSYWAGETINDDFVIDYDGQLFIESTDLYNNRAPTLKTLTVDSATDVFTSTAHSLDNGWRINASSTGTLPAPLTANTNYYIRDATANTFKLAATQTGSAIDITSTGSGTHSVFRPVEPAIRSGLGLVSTPIRGSVISLNNTYVRPSGAPVMDFIPIYDSNALTSSFVPGSGYDGYSGPSNNRGLQIFSFGDKSKNSDGDTDVNFPPRIQAHMTYLMGISTTATAGKNLRGSVTFGSSDTATVTFNAAEPDANYFIAISGNAAEVFWATSKSTTGFTIRSSNPTSTASCDWIIVR